MSMFCNASFRRENTFVFRARVDVANTSICSAMRCERCETTKHETRSACSLLSLHHLRPASPYAPHLPTQSTLLAASEQLPHLALDPTDEL